MASEISSNALRAEERSSLARMVMKLMDLWVLDLHKQAVLLDLPMSSRLKLARYRSGSPIGPGRDQLDRVGHLLGIHKNLRLLFPQNRGLAYGWMTTSNKAFDDLTPVEVVQKWGFSGLLMVRTYLDRAIGHNVIADQS